jgi:exo-beta-1,3-glucanase (GH17 family)
MLIARTVIPILALALFAEAQINYFGVAYSPYVRSDGALWNSYTVEDIKKMLRIVLTYHNSLSTYSMGVSQWNNGKPWDQADSNCLVARAAAQINKERNSVVLSVSQGIFQNDDAALQAREINNAFSAAADANTIFRGTVWGLVFTNEFVTDGSNGPRVLKMIQDNKARANGMGLKVGTRIHTCGEIWGGPNQAIIKQIVRASDFIMCNLYPPPNSNNADAAVKAISDGYYSARDGFWRENPAIEVQIGETGWASEGQTFFNPPHLNTIPLQTAFWQKMKEWAMNNKVKVQMFEAFDEPWKTGMSGEKKFGWWHRANDNSNYYIEKSTGKRFD